MATRINKNIWGAPSAQITVDNGAPYNDYHKVSPYSYTDIMSAHSEYVNAPYDKSVTIWGVPSDCSAGAFTTFSWWYADNHIQAELIPPDSDKNVPMTLLSDAYSTGERLYWGTIDTYGSAYIKNRTKGGISVVTDSYTFDVDADTTITANHKIKTEENNLAYPNAQITSYIYNKYLLVPWVSLTGEIGQPTNYTYVWSNPYDNVYNTSWDSVKSTLNCNDNQVLCCGIGFNRWGVNGNNPSTRSLAYKSAFMPQPLTKFSLSQRAKTSYGIDDFEPCYTLQPMPFIGMGARVSQNLSPTNPTFITGSAANSAPTPTTYFGSSNYVPNGSYCDCIIRISQKRQVFSDVEYHWTIGIKWLNYMLDFYGDTTNLNDWLGMRVVPFLKIDDTKGDTYKNAVFKAVLHELAFFGLPFAKSETAAQTAIWDNNCEDIYIPLFDENMITTGEYVTLKEAYAQQLPQTTWNDIFEADEVVNYDPDYQPPEPEPTDYGYLDNKPTSNHIYSSNNRVYALTAAQYSQFIKDINSLYLDDPQTGFDSFQLDFKGTNPSDYIIGTYGYTFLPAGLIPNQQPESIQIGAVTLPNAEGYRIAPSYIYNYKSLGQIDLTGAGDYKPFGDFRDFEPYTHIELYIPLCGNIKLDPAAVVGHTIQIDMVFDIMTGNATACIYRDNQTLIATIAGQLAASLPLSSGRMGDYQNAIKSAENALKQNELKTTTAAATVAIGVGAALLAPETGGLSLAAYGAAITGGASLLSLSNQKNQIEYEIEHKQPSISVCSAANGAVAQNISSMYAVCYVKQCKMLSSYNAKTYAHTIGHACVINTTIGDQTTEDSNSLIVCSNADLSGIPATAAEINAIQSLLTGGIYV